MLNKTVFTILSLFFCLNTFGQNSYIIQGYVLNENSYFYLENGLKNARVTIIGTQQSTQTDSTGYFKFSVEKPGSYNLKIESIGYISQTVNRSSIDKEKQDLDLINPFSVLLNRTFDKPINNNSTSELTTTISKYNLIQNAAPTLPDAISQVSGVWMSRPSYMNNAISIRGMTGNRNTVFLDGIPLNHSMLSNRPEGLLNLVNMFEVQEIKVSKGGATVNAGDGALGGVINISTTSPDYSDGALQTKVFASTRISNSSEFLLNGGSEISAENFAIRYGLSLHSVGRIGDQAPTGYDQLGGHLKGLIYLDRSQLEFGYNGIANLDRSDVTPNVDDLYLDNLPQDQDRQMAYVKFNKVVRKGPFRIIKAKLAYQRFNEQIQESLSPSSTYRLENTNNNLWFNLTGTSNLGEGWKMLSGIELKQEFVNSEAYIADSSSGITPVEDGTYLRDAKYSKVSLYNIHTLRKENWNFEFGARGNWMNLEGVMLSVGNVQNRPLSIAGNIKTTYRISNKHQIIGGINSNYRTPTFENFLVPSYINNLVGPNNRFNFNNNLAAEKSVNFEFAYRVTTPRFNSQLALYRNQLIDAFDFTSTIEPFLIVYQPENAGKGYIQGAELDIDAVLTSNFKLTGNITYTHGQETYQNLPMRYIPPVHGMLTLNYQYKNKLTSSLTYQFAGMQTSNAPENIFGELQEEIPVAAWNILNFSVGYQLKKVNLSGGIRNILDENYRLYGSNINEYRRNLWFGFRYNM